MARLNRRADHIGTGGTQYNKARQRILHSQEVCGICGKLVDKDLKYPNPLSATVDHIIPIAKGGHPYSLENLQLAHWICNRLKSDKNIFVAQEKRGSQIYQTRDWRNF